MLPSRGMRELRRGTDEGYGRSSRAHGGRRNGARASKRQFVRRLCVSVCVSVYAFDLLAARLAVVGQTGTPWLSWVAVALAREGEGAPLEGFKCFELGLEARQL